jgi:hypothetical protein
LTPTLQQPYRGRNHPFTVDDFLSVAIRPHIGRILAAHWPQKDLTRP